MVIEVAELCSTLCDPMDCSPPRSSVEFSKQEYWSGLPFPSPKTFMDATERKKKNPDCKRHKAELLTDCHLKVLLFSLTRTTEHPTLVRSHSTCRQYLELAKR